ncbi:ImmA/IrrE family metallo-endopeptidase [Clostridium perfringens]|uniref:ImmA/IrrE family metallo-endopeptidase n=1 Tax=Clostridium perfringens TaxID=1502 RepID=UPI00285770B5|nr:ImmA/IrrE family metallo-endopeptidase [Clostridium perfringens]MDM0848415.1 ImmA/IrrE family metallo-endopeptidase [Clostridium perfringens]
MKKEEKNKLDKEEKNKLEKEAEIKALEFRKKYNIKEEPIDDIYSLAFAKEFFILKFPFKEEISGAYIEKKGRGDIKYKCIYINTAEPIGRLSFSFMHEIYHAFFEKSVDSSFSYNQSKDPVEIKANNFASYILIPRSYLVKRLNEISNGRLGWKISYNDLFKLQMEFKVSFIALVYAIDSLEEKIKPQNIGVFYKYKYKKYWGELERKSLAFDRRNNLNSCNLKIEWPRNFKENIEKNISMGISFRDELEDIFDFFEG